MTDKQIIIDGVDVSGCKYFANNKCLMLGATGTACDVYPYCYYKALKAKEQELDQLKAENEELKKCYKNNSALLDFEETNTTKLVNKVMKLEKTLTEIKEIAEGCGKRIPLFEIDEIADDLKQILQKISEVENVRN